MYILALIQSVSLNISLRPVKNIPNTSFTVFLSLMLCRLSALHFWVPEWENVCTGWVGFSRSQPCKPEILFHRAWNEDSLFWFVIMTNAWIFLQCTVLDLVWQFLFCEAFYIRRLNNSKGFVKQNHATDSWTKNLCMNSLTNIIFSCTTCSMLR